MIRMKQRWKFTLKEEAPAHLPQPMPTSLQEANRELELCEQRGDWTRAAALRYSAIPYLERVPPEPTPKPATTQAPAPTYTRPPADIGRLLTLAALGTGGVAILAVWIWIAGFLAEK